MSNPYSAPLLTPFCLYTSVFYTFSPQKDSSDQFSKLSMKPTLGLNNEKSMDFLMSPIKRGGSGANFGEKGNIPPKSSFLDSKDRKLVRGRGKALTTNSIRSFNGIENKKGGFVIKKTLNRQATTMTVVREAKAVVKYDDDGDKIVNQYRIITELGRGAFGKVKLVESNANFKKYVRFSEVLRAVFHLLGWVLASRVCFLLRGYEKLPKKFDFYSFSKIEDLTKSVLNAV